MNTLLIFGLVLGLVPGLTALADKVPSEDQIGPGWIWAVVFVLLGAAVIFLAFSLVKHLRKARANAESGVFDSRNDPSR
jgi:hypothetical protein